MALFKIKQGQHYHTLLPPSILPWVGARSMSRLVTFDANCAYDAPAYNEQDANKLFGLSFGFGGVHHNSARFGWRWSHADQCIELLAYCYVNGQRNQDEQLRFPVVGQILPGGPPVRCEVAAAWQSGPNQSEQPVYTFLAEGQGISGLVAVPRVDVPHYGITHGLYFGGELTAPHDMTVRIDRP